MKRFMMFIIFAGCLLQCSPAVSQYLSTTRDSAAAPGDVASSWCDMGTLRSLTFDLQTINADTKLDLAIGKSIRNTDTKARIRYYGFQDYNNGSGGFPSQDGNFFSDPGSNPCNDYNRINGLEFGKLRPNEPKKDLAVLRDGGIYLYYNSENGISSNTNNPYSGVAKEGA